MMFVDSKFMTKKTATMCGFLVSSARVNNQSTSFEAPRQAGDEGAPSNRFCHSLSV